jgi:hypothetical protein
MAHFSDTLRHSMMSQLTTALTTTSRLLIYTGSQPLKTAAPSGTLLATFTLAATPGSDTAGVYTFTPPANVVAVAAGSPQYARLIDGTTDDGTHTVMQISCGVGSGELSFASLIAMGGTVSISSLVVTEGNG